MNEAINNGSKIINEENYKYVIVRHYNHNESHKSGS